MTRVTRLGFSRRVLTPLYGVLPDSVPSERQLSASLHRLARPDAVAVGLSVGRIGLGALFLAAPVLSVQVLGVDTATAKRMRFLARMAAARDISLGAGALAERGPGASSWVLASAACDVVDAAVITAAVRRGTLRPLPAGAVAVGAAMAAATGTWAALRLRRT